MFVVCKLPNAGEVINGIRFRPLPGVGMVSVEPVDEEVVRSLARIPGYEPLEALPDAGKGSGRAKANEADSGAVVGDDEAKPAARSRRAG